MFKFCLKIWIILNSKDLIFIYFFKVVLNLGNTEVNFLPLKRIFLGIFQIKKNKKLNFPKLKIWLLIYSILSTVILYENSRFWLVYSLNPEVLQDFYFVKK